MAPKSIRKSSQAAAAVCVAVLAAHGPAWADGARGLKGGFLPTNSMCYLDTIPGGMELYDSRVDGLPKAGWGVVGRWASAGDSGGWEVLPTMNGFHLGSERATGFDTTCYRDLANLKQQFQGNLLLPDVYNCSDAVRPEWSGTMTCWPFAGDAFPADGGSGLGAAEALSAPRGSRKALLQYRPDLRPAPPPRPENTWCFSENAFTGPLVLDSSAMRGGLGLPPGASGKWQLASGGDSGEWTATPGGGFVYTSERATGVNTRCYTSGGGDGGGAPYVFECADTTRPDTDGKMWCFVDTWD